jgi:hypothetical protein
MLLPFGDTLPAAWCSSHVRLRRDWMISWTGPNLSLIEGMRKQNLLFAGSMA